MVTTCVGILHVLFSPRAEGCPRLAFELIAQERQQRGRAGGAAFCELAPPTLLPEFRSLDVPIFDLRLERHRYWAFLRHIYGVLKRLRPAGVICYTVGFHVLVGIAARRFGIPMVLHLGNSPPKGDINALRKINLQMQVGKFVTTAYAACSEYVQNESILQYRLPNKKVCVVPNGINLSRYAALRTSRIVRPPGSPLTVGMIASLEQHKNHSLLLHAFAALRFHRHDVELRVIGGGSLEGQLKKLASELGVERHVHWTGAVSDVTGELMKLDLFAFCTTPMEGMGIALVEALAAGVPVVVSNVGACREVLKDGRLGCLVSEETPEAWARALSMVSEIPVPDVDVLQEYDIARTFRSYERLLGLSA